MPNKTIIPELEDKFIASRPLAKIDVPDLGIKLYRYGRMPIPSSFYLDYVYPFIVKIPFTKRRDKAVIPFIYHGFSQLPYIYDVLYDLYQYAYFSTFRNALDRFMSPSEFNRDTFFKLQCYMLRTYKILNGDNQYCLQFCHKLQEVFLNVHRYTFFVEGSDNRHPIVENVAVSGTFRIVLKETSTGNVQPLRYYDVATTASLARAQTMLGARLTH